MAEMHELISVARVLRNVTVIAEQLAPYLLPVSLVGLLPIGRSSNAIVFAKDATKIVYIVIATAIRDLSDRQTRFAEELTGVLQTDVNEISDGRDVNMPME